MATNVDDQIYENKKVQMMTQMWVILALVLSVTLLGGLYLVTTRPTHSPIVTMENCAKLCGENGVDDYNADACKCLAPKAVMAPRIEHMTCECSPAAKSLP